MKPFSRSKSIRSNSRLDRTYQRWALESAVNRILYLCEKEFSWRAALAAIARGDQDDFRVVCRLFASESDVRLAVRSTIADEIGIDSSDLE